MIYNTIQDSTELKRAKEEEQQRNMLNSNSNSAAMNNGGGGGATSASAPSAAEPYHSVKDSSSSQPVRTTVTEYRTVKDHSIPLLPPTQTIVQALPVTIITEQQQQQQRQQAVVPPAQIPSALLVDSLDDHLHYCDAFILHLALGFFGALHFRMGRPVLGLIYFFTVGGFGLGYVVDFIRLQNLVRDYNRHRRTKSEEYFQGHESAETLIGDSYALWGMSFLGANHFYLKRYGWGIFYLLTCGAFGVGMVVDLLRIPCLVKQYLKDRDEEKKSNEYIPYRTSDVYVLWLSPFGFLGAHYLYLGEIKMFYLYFFTFGLFGIGWIADFFRIPRVVRDINIRNFEMKQRNNGTAGMEEAIPDAIRADV
jgi:TM2 domain-containing membrane protein YozV